MDRNRAWVPKRWTQDKREQDKAERGNRGTERTRDTQNLRTKSKSLRDRSVAVQWQGVTEKLE